MIQTIGNKIVGSKKHDSYLELFAKFTPRPITTESQFLATQNVIDSLICLLYTSPSPRDLSTSRMPSSA